MTNPGAVSVDGRPAAGPRKVLVAGVGNVFLGDDGFGVEVAARLAGHPMPAGVRVADYGIRGVHLAYELLNGYDALILVDAVRAANRRARSASSTRTWTPCRRPRRPPRARR